MNRIFKFKCFCLFTLLSVFLSCKEEEVPVVITQEITDITEVSANCNGTITSQGSKPVITKGICWGENPTPTIYDKKTTLEGAGEGNFTCSITGLTDGTPYNVRAYATNSCGTGYGMIISFTTTDCMKCKDVTTDDRNGEIVLVGQEVQYCGTDLELILAKTPVSVGGFTTKWVCSD